MAGRSKLTAAFLLLSFIAVNSVSAEIREISKPLSNGFIYNLRAKLALKNKALPKAETTSNIECGSEKFVAKCDTCCKEYYYCYSAGASPVLKECTGGLVFNPDPLYARCILPSNCPYHPPWTAPPTSPAPTTRAVTTTGPPTTTGTGTTNTPGTTVSGATEATTEPASTIVTTTGPAPTSECIDSLTCEGTGFYAKCVTCKRDYFKCSQVGQPGELKQCSAGYVFNPDKAYPRCIMPSNCPYHP